MKPNKDLKQRIQDQKQQELLQKQTSQKNNKPPAYAGTLKDDKSTITQPTKNSAYLTIILKARQLDRPNRSKPSLKQMNSLAFYYATYDLSPHLSKVKYEPDTKYNAMQYLKALKKLEDNNKLIKRNFTDYVPYNQVLAQLIQHYG